MKFHGELVSVLADTADRASDAAPWWFTGLVGLVGTIVGGIITYVTTTRANKQEAEAERERQRKAEVRDISIRFIRLITRPQMQQEKIEAMMKTFSAAIEEVSHGRDPQQVLAEAGGLNPLGPNLGARTDEVKAVQGLIKEVGRMAGHVSESVALLAEMRLVAPRRVTQIAEIASNSAIREQLMEQLGQTTPEGTRTLQEVLVIFTDEVRREMGSDAFVSMDGADADAVKEFLDKLAA